MLEEVNPLKFLDEFLSVFGDITIADAIVFILACVFLLGIYNQVKKYVDSKVNEQKQAAVAEQVKAEEEKALKQKIEEAYCVTQKYPVYHQESITIRDALNKEIQEIRSGLDAMMKRFEEIEEQNKKRECSKLRDMLLQNYRYYTNVQQNPSQSWTRMESEAFWELFGEYEAAGGDGYMHTEVQPAMMRLTIIEVGQR
jgi:hypothetical protein